MNNGKRKIVLHDLPKDILILLISYIQETKIEQYESRIKELEKHDNRNICSDCGNIVSSYFSGCSKCRNVLCKRCYEYNDMNNRLGYCYECSYQILN